MITTLLFVSNPTRARTLGLQLCKALKADVSKTLVLCCSGMPVKFRFPRGGQLSDYPQVAAPQYAFDKDSLWRSYKGSALLAGINAAVLMSSDEISKLFSSATLMAYAADPYGSHINDFHQLLELCPASADRSVRYGYLPSLSEEAAAAAFDESAEPRMAKLEHFGIVKRYFEWNWLANAHVILSQALRSVGADTDKATLSKFGLQALYWLKANMPVMPQQRPHTESELVRAFGDWKGTGKYEKNSLGSPTSYLGLITQLRSLGLVEVSDKGRRTQISTRGLEFLAKLHPGCEDADLPARLGIWGEQGFDASKDSIDRYIRTFFGRQLRFSTKNDFS